MAKNNYEIGVVGLGRMGGDLSLQALGKGIRVAGYTVEGASAELLEAGLREVKSLEGFRKELKPPRMIFIYIPAGPAVDEVIKALTETLEKDDIIIDGGNSYWGDSIRRHEMVEGTGMHFVDLGTSGGVEGARKGACFMAGGDKGPVSVIEPVLLQLAVAGGYVHAGPAGMGHFVKLVHNGIEFGMLQAIGEGVGLLEHNKDKIDIPGVLGCWRHGSVIRSWLVDLLDEAYKNQGGLEKVSPFIEDTGEVNWLVSDAVQMEVPIPVIAMSVMALFTSRDGVKDWARAIAMMRHGFGGHPFGPSEPVRRERVEGRVGDIVKTDISGKPSRKVA